MFNLTYFFPLNLVPDLVPDLVPLREQVRNQVWDEVLRTYFCLGLLGLLGIVSINCLPANKGTNILSLQRVKEVNAERFRKARKLGVLPRDEHGRYHFTSTSFDAEALKTDPSLELGYIVAPPRMKLYEQISTQIVSTYMKYVSADDILVYSIDEVFIDLTGYLKTYAMTAHELVM